MPPLLSTLFNEAKKAVDTVLPLYLENSDIPPLLSEAITFSVKNGGKRLRPALMLACANLFQVPKAQIARVSTAIEMIHSYSLIHDDLPAMDNADVRRGQPSCWRKFGEATAILAGDSLLPLAFEVLVDEATHPNPLVRLSLIKELAVHSGAAGMAGGQMMDLSPHLILSPEMAVAMQNLKTGCLMAFSCEAAAILAEASPQDRQQLRRFGALFGLAYQIQDDLLDIEGHAKDLGKPVGIDSEKRSLIAFLGVEESRQRLGNLQSEMFDLIQSYQEPVFNEIISWATTRRA